MKRLGLAVLSGFLVAGCANTDLNVVKAVPAPPKAVSLSIIDQSKGSQLQEEMLDLKNIIKSELEDEGINVVSDPKGAVSLAGQFNSYDSGNRALRYFVGFGAGKAQYASNWKLVSSTGEEIGDCNIDGWLAMGFFGGSVSKMNKGLAEAVVDCVKGEK